MYEPRESESDLAALGLSAEDVAEDNPAPMPYPENAPAWALFQRMATQWRVGLAGATGLDYGTVIEVMALMGVRKRERLETLDKVRVMEAEALACMREAAEE